VVLTSNGLQRWVKTYVKSPQGRHSRAATHTIMGAMVAVQFFHVAAFGAAVLVFGAVIALVLSWREEGTRAAQRLRSRNRHTALNAPARIPQTPRRDEPEEIELSA
jgi:hypothetical protein